MKQAFLLLLGVTSFVSAQTQTIDIQDPQNQMQAFYQSLEDLETGKRSQVNVVHIGDSHLQADAFSGYLREEFQRRYGSLGPGMIFPHRIANSNQPLWVRSAHSGEWIGQSQVSSRHTLPMGCMGFTAQTADTMAVLEMRIKDRAFDKMFVWRQRDSNACGIQITAGNPAESYVFQGGLGPTPDTLTFSSEESGFTLSILPERDSCDLQLHGFQLQTGNHGLGWWVLGANGARFDHWRQNDSLWSQLPRWNPDLIVISLGTNEAFSGSVYRQGSGVQAERMITEMQTRMAGVPILVTTPGDGFRKGRRNRFTANPGVPEVRDSVLAAVHRTGVASWDLYQAMGGAGSMREWVAQGLAAKDHVHFTTKGYRLQGELLWNAFMKAMQNRKTQP